MKKVLITGIGGFVGKYLAEHLQSTGEYEIVGTSRSDKSPSDKIKIEQVDLLDAAAVMQLISSNKPEYVYHLAAQASPAESIANPVATLTNNILAELNILEALRRNEMQQTRTLIVSTSEIYGIVDPVDLPVDEDTPLKPFNPYAVSKIAQDYMGLQYYLTYKLDVIRVRPFNHVGPGQNEKFVLPSFAKQIAEVEKKKQEPVIKVGNLEAKRDFTDVRDIVRAYQMLMEKGASGDVYNLGSGKSYAISDLLNKLLALSTDKIEIEIDKTRFRPLDVLDIYCDYGKCAKLTGWHPEIEIDKSLQDILDYYRKMV
jgi:GDP-4-dehydro-6-deoxy-D-mannose reductase